MSPEARDLTREPWTPADWGDALVGLLAYGAACVLLGMHLEAKPRPETISLTYAAPKPASNVRMDCREAMPICRARAKEAAK